MIITTYFPSRTKTGHPFNQWALYHSSLADLMVDLFGGMTEWDGRGYYRMANGEVVCEKVTIMTSFTMEGYKGIPTLIELLGECKLALMQESWAYALDSTLYLI